MTVKGRAKASWSTGGSRNRKHHLGKDVYMNETKYLFGSRTAEPQIIQIGVHRYDFEIQLPAALPATLELRHGGVRYNIEACLDCPWRLDREYKVEFTVRRNDDYNAYPELKIPRVVEQEIDTSTCFTSSKPLNATVSIPYSVYTPGSQIPISFHLDNQGKFDVEKIYFNLKQYSDFHRLNIHIFLFF